MSKANGKMSSPRLDKLVGYFLATRDEIEEIEKRHKEELAPFRQAKERVAAELLEALDATGQEMARTKAGTVTAVVHDTAICKDPNAFIDYVRTHDAYELMDRRANKTACRAFLQEHGQLPPGVALNSKRDVNVRSPAQKGEI